jgi:hypothetical protein
MSVAYRPTFTVALSLAVFVLVFARCIYLWFPIVDPDHYPVWMHYGFAATKAALEAFAVLCGSYVGMRLARASAAKAPRKVAIFLAVPLAAIGLLQGRVRIPVTMDCGEGIVCNPYGWDLVLEWNLHYIFLVAASAVVAFLVGRSSARPDSSGAA